MEILLKYIFLQCWNFYTCPRKNLPTSDLGGLFVNRPTTISLKCTSFLCFRFLLRPSLTLVKQKPFFPFHWCLSSRPLNFSLSFLLLFSIGFGRTDQRSLSLSPPFSFLIWLSLLIKKSFPSTKVGWGWIVKEGEKGEEEDESQPDPPESREISLLPPKKVVESKSASFFPFSLFFTTFTYVLVYE